MEILKRFFEQTNAVIKRTGTLTAADIRDAAASCGNYSGADAEIMIADAESWGIDVKTDLAELDARRAEAQAARAEQERRANIKTNAAKIRRQIDTLDAVIDTAPMDEISANLTELNTQAAGLVTTAGSVNLFPTYGDYNKAWEKQSADDFMPSMFGKLGFPDGTLNYIGARTGRGKTTAMVNIGIDALFPFQENTQPRKVLFISLEETQIEIISRFVLCLAYRDSTEGNRAELLKVKTPWGEHEPAKTYGAWRQRKNLYSGEGIKVFIEAVSAAEQKIKIAIESGKLIFFDGIEAANVSQILAAIRGRAGRGDVVLFDYIQKIADKQTAEKTTLERTREGSDKLRQTAKQRECVIISGAQFNRAGQERGANDTFNDADFKDCGDIEQDGHILIGIGRNADKTQTYYNVIKARRAKTTDALFNLDFAGGYSYMGHAGGIFENPKAPNKKPKRAPINDGELLGK